MTKTGAVLLAVLWTMSCIHTRETEDVQEERTTEKKPQRAARRDTEVKRPAYAGRPELSSDPAGLMKPEGPMKIQRRLAALGYYSGEVTGELDDTTSAALVKFQAEYGLAKTGAPDRDTVKALGLDVKDVWRKNYGE